LKWIFLVDSQEQLDQDKFRLKIRPSPLALLGPWEKFCLTHAPATGKFVWTYEEPNDNTPATSAQEAK
jgi:hypothetical protein